MLLRWFENVSAVRWRQVILWWNIFATGSGRAAGAVQREEWTDWIVSEMKIIRFDAKKFSLPVERDLKLPARIIIKSCSEEISFARRRRQRRRRRPS